MRIFFTGISGLLGRYFFEANPDASRHQILGTSRVLHPGGVFDAIHRYEAIPFQEQDRYADLIAMFKPDVIVHAGGEGNVDLVQQDPDQARRTNVQFPVFLLEQARKSGARIVQFSSNAVYDGGSAPYSEASTAQPINKYGEFKAEVDAETRSFPGDWVIFRPIVAYGWNFPFGRANPVSQFVPLMMEGRNLKLVDDVFENPVYAGDVAEALWRCLLEGFTGELNVAGGDEGVNRYQWMRTVAEVFGCDPSRLEPVPLSAFKSLAPRPKDTRFDISKLLSAMKFRPVTVREGAELMKKDSKRGHVRP